MLRKRCGTISEERGIEWCEEFERGSPLFIVSTVRPNGMGRRRWRHGYGLLEAWPAVAIDRWSTGDVLLASLREQGGTISEERGVRWCEEIVRGWPLFIVELGDRRGAR